MALDRLAVVFKCGDQPGDGLKHMDPVALYSERDWGIPLEKIISANMHRVFLVMEFDPKMRPFFEDATKPIGVWHDNVLGVDIPHPINYRARQKRLDLAAVMRDLKMPNLEADALSRHTGVSLVRAHSLNENHFIDASILSRDTGVFDRNSISSGAVTYGSGGTYADRVALFADIANLTGNLTATMISDIVQTAIASLNVKLNAHTLTLTSNKWGKNVQANGWLNTINESGSGFTGLQLAVPAGDSEGTIRCEYLNEKIAGSGSSAFNYFNGAPSGTAVVIQFFDSIIDGNAIAHSNIGINFNDTNNHIVAKLENVIVQLFKTSAQIASNALASILSRHLTLIGDGTAAVSGYNNVNNSGILDNIISFGFAAGYCFRNMTNAGDFSKCASTDTTGSEAALRSLTASNELLSTSISNANYCLVKSGGQCQNGGAAIIQLLNHGIRGNARPRGSLRSIGVDEWKQYYGVPAGIF
jgi:hypothetical protein